MPVLELAKLLLVPLLRFYELTFSQCQWICQILLHIFCKSFVQFSRSVVSNSLQSHGLQHARLPYPSPTPGVCPISCLLSWWCHPTISSLVAPSPLPLNFPQHQGLFHWVSSSHQIAKVLELQVQHQSFQWIFRVDFLKDWLVWSC